VRDMIIRHQLPGCAPTPGKLSVVRYEDGDNLKRMRDKMATDFDFHLDYLDRQAVREKLKTDRYFQALRDNHGFHFHPLNYCLGLARLIERSGGKIHEQSPMVRVESRRWTPPGGHRFGALSIARDVVYCCGGYGGPEFGKFAPSLSADRNLRGADRTPGQRLADAVNTTDAVGDNRRASDYYRIVDGDRLLWGGRITTRNLQDEKRLGQLLTEDILDVYPQLRGVKIEKAWSGLMGYARHKMPHIGPLGNRAVGMYIIWWPWYEHRAYRRTRHRRSHLRRNRSLPPVRCLRPGMERRPSRPGCSADGLCRFEDHGLFQETRSQRRARHKN
jgi:gamma-glutamylputrescine oxidase